MKKIASASLLGLTAVALSACSLSGGASSSNVSAGSLAEHADLTDVAVAVGGKEFTEQQILCEITAQALESVNADITRQCGMNGSATVRSALTSGAIDMYWEYTGTGWITHLGQNELISDPDELSETLNREDRKENSIAWLPPAPANNTYAIAASSELSDELGIKTISDYAALANKDASKASFCGAAEFFGRNDGWPGLQKEYHFSLPAAGRSELAAGAIYNGIDKKDPCNFGEVFATDGRIKALGLTVLEDDKHYFTPYNPALSIRTQLLDERPDIEDVFKPISEALTNETLQQLNAEVDVDGRAASEVANDWLKSNGFIS